MIRPPITDAQRDRLAQLLDAVANALTPLALEPDDPRPCDLAGMALQLVREAADIVGPPPSLPEISGAVLQQFDSADAALRFVISHSGGITP